MAARYDIQLNQGNSFTLNVTLLDSEGAALDLTGSSFTAIIGGPSVPIATFTDAAGAESNEWTFSLTAAETEDLFSGMYTWELQWTDANDEPWDLLRGRARVREGQQGAVTQAAEITVTSESVTVEVALPGTQGPTGPIGPQGPAGEDGFTGVHNDLDGRDTSTAHPTSAITGLDAALAGKEDTGHTHTEADVTDLAHYTDTDANAAIDLRVSKAFVDALNVDADTLDGSDSTAFATSGHTHTGAEVSFTPAGSIEAATVQAAIEELDTEKSPTDHNHNATHYTETETDALIDAIVPRFNSASGVWSGDAPAGRADRERCVSFKGPDDPSDPTLGIDTPANLVIGDEWVETEGYI